MKKKPWKNKKGFTLVELIVVLVILAILIALLVPALTGYIDKARKKAKLLECRQCVVAAQTMLSEMYGATNGITNDVLGTQLNGEKDTIKKLAEVPGTITKIVTKEPAVVSKLTYQATNGLNVIYEKGHDPEYYISDDKIYSESAPGYLEWANDTDFPAEMFYVDGDTTKELKDEYKDLFDGRWNAAEYATKRVQALFRKKYGGDFPKVDVSELKLPDSLGKKDTLDNCVWKPMIDKNNKIFMVADSKGTAGSNAMASLIYYEGKYYYHKNGSDIRAEYVSDKNWEINLEDILKKNDWVETTQ